MGRTTLSPESYGKAAAAWNAEFFKIRIYNESDPERLKAVIEHEVDRQSETRKDRIAAVNQRLQTLSERGDE